MKKLLLLSILFCSIAKAQLVPPLYAVIAPQTVSYDADAVKYFTAVANAGVTLNSTQKGAVNTYVVYLKANSVWTKFKAIYLPIWGTAASSAINLIDTSLYRITWVGSPTFGSTGVAMNGTSQYGNAGLSPSTVGRDDIEFGVDIQTNTAAGLKSDIGSGDNAPTPNTYAIIFSRYHPNAADEFWGTANGAGNQSDYGVSTNTDSRGFSAVKRTSSSSETTYKNGSVAATSSGTSSAASTYNFYLGATNLSGTANFYGDRTYSLWFISTSMTDTENSNIYSALQTMKTTLGI